MTAATVQCTLKATRISKFCIWIFLFPLCCPGVNPSGKRESMAMAAKNWLEKTTLSLRSKLVLAGILILLIPMTIIGSVTFVQSSRTLEEISSLQLVQVAEGLSGMIQISLEKDLRNLNSMAADPQVIRDTMAGEYKNIQKKLSVLYQLLAADFEGIAVYDTHGIIRADGADSARIGISITERNYFASAKEGKTGVGPMVPSKATGAPIFGLSAPIVSPDGEFIGGVLGVLKAQYLATYIAAIRLGKTGYVFMIDQQGTSISHPDQTKILKKNIRDEAETMSLAQKMIEQQKTSVAYNYRGTPKVAGICPIPLTGWSIGATQNKKEIMSLAYANMRFLLLVSAFFVVLIILAVIFFSKTISTPVQTTLTTLNTAINQAAEAFVIIGIDGNVRFANPAMAAAIDRPMADIVGHSFRPDTDNPEVNQEIQQAMKKQTVWSGHFKGSRQNGESHTLNVTLTPVLDPTGNLMCYLAVGRDITKELMMQEQLQQSQKMEAIGTLAGGIAHDFNNILSAIFGYTDLARHHLSETERLQQYLGQIMSSAKRARDLVSRILTFSRKSDMGRSPLVPKEIIIDTVKLLRASLPSTIEIKASLESDAAVIGNATQIHQMTMNLCTNAGYEMRETGGTLEITLDETHAGADMCLQYPKLQSGQYLRLTVADSGKGIEQDVLDRIFDPFFTTKPTGAGTGLGLSVVHGIAKGMGGEIMVSSQPGKGTAFTVLLPIAELHQLSLDETEHEALPRGTERILLVDDEEAIIHSTQNLLEKLGYTVEAFNGSPSAWNAFSADPDAFDIIVTDYTMPQMTGIKLSEKVRQTGSSIPIVLCSGYLELKEKLSPLQPIEFVKKPVTANELANAIRHVMDRSDKDGR